jgi:NADPH:quinone reductase-like Zn-dependent oxidoreductase
VPILEAMSETIRPAIEHGRIRPVIDHTYDLAEPKAVDARLRSGKADGKIVLTID